MLNPKNAINRLIKQYALDIRVPENATTRDTRGHQKNRPDAALKAGRNEEPPGEEKKRNLTTKCGKMATGKIEPCVLVAELSNVLAQSL